MVWCLLLSMSATGRTFKERRHDLTYVSTWSGFAQVGFVIDAYARRILGWRVPSTMAAAMVLEPSNKQSGPVNKKAS